jgi:2-keto-4-pentenoate hydratase/2-oxohepta-3-ene-1,7-dioic acid hydratase in catechol pathway
MKLLTFRRGSELRVGLLGGDGRTVYDLSGRVPPGVGVRELVERWAELGPGLDEDLASLPAAPLAELSLAAPIPVPRRNLFAVGKNYLEHATEFSRSGFDATHRAGDADTPDRPIVFSIATTAVTGPYDPVDLHVGLARQIDYEAELAVIIGVGGRGINAGSAFDHVWGYTIVNDVTARDLQRAHKQWLLGKSLDTHCPMGPFAVSADEVDLEGLMVECRVNGELRQKAPVSDLIFDIPTLIETISAGITLLPGDIIATGTPAGVGIGHDPPKFLGDGDVVEVSITGLGTLRNEFRAGVT